MLIVRRLLLGATLLQVINAETHAVYRRDRLAPQQTVLITEMDPDAIAFEGSSPEFWSEATNLGDKLRKYASDTLNELSSKYALGDKIASLKSSVSEFAKETESSLREVASHLPVDVHITKIAEELQVQLANKSIPEKLKEQFPPPSQAPSHEDRERLVGAVYEVFLNEVDVAMDKVHASEDKKEKVKGSLRNIQPTITKIAVTTSDLTQQHPVILELLIIAVTVELMPLLFFRPFIRLLGFGPLGPIEGSLAAFTQRYLFGATIPAGSWFSFLQRAGMVPGGWLARFFTGLFGGMFGWLRHIFGF